MRKFLGALGFIVMLMGISGAIAHLWHQPILGLFLNVLHREFYSQMEFFNGYELAANIVTAVVGVIIMVAADSSRSR